MKTKILTLIAVAIISLLTTSYAFACLTANPQINFYNPNIEYVTVETNDNESTNIANIQAQIANDHETINVQIRNAYPNYEAQIAYTIKNTGNYPVEFNAPTIINPNPDAINVITTNHQNVILQPGQATHGTATLQTLANAQQNYYYSFQITHTATATPPETARPETCHPHTTNFWAEQLKLHLNGKCNQAKIDAATLEEYLIQISSQSKIFKFTGSQTQKFQQALNVLTPSNNANAETKLKAQLLAVWLNQMANWTANFKIDNKTANLIIQNAETVLIRRQIYQYQTWKVICELFNNIG